MNLDTFFAHIRGSAFLGIAKLSSVQVITFEAIINRAQVMGLPLQQVAYILATAWHEAKAEPVRENLTYTSAERIRMVWPSRFPTVASAQPYVRNPQALANKVYGDRLGNRPGTSDGYIYRGGGLDQLTGRDNYARIGIADNPGAILNPETAVSSLIGGMTSGRYRGRKLSDYINTQKTDYRGAREIVNADRNRLEGGLSVGNRVARYAEAFEAALIAAGYKSGGTINLPSVAGALPTASVPPWAIVSLVIAGALLVAVIGGK